MHGINVLWHNDCFRRNFTAFVFERTSATIEYIEQVFHRHRKMWVHQYILVVLIHVGSCKKRTQEFHFYAKLKFSSHCKQHN